MSKNNKVQDNRPSSKDNYPSISKDYPSAYKDRSPKIFQRGKIKEALSIRPFDFSPKQQQLIDIVLSKDSKVIFINGPAGTGKTLLSVYCALELLNQKRISDVIFVRSIIESASKALGSLPGEAEAKFKPFLLPLEDKLEELLPRADIDYLFKDQRIHPVPINFLRGASYNAKVIIGEEAQNFTFKELTTLVTRIGEFSKFIVLGDDRQSDLNGRSGFRPMFDLFNNDESHANGIYTFEFTREDVKRSGVLKFILERLELYEEGVKKH